MKQYKKVKESGVEWLGEIPTHWALQRLKQIAAINPHKSVTDVEELVTFLPMEKVGEKGQIDCSIKRPAKDLLAGFTSFEKDDVILAKITPCFENGKGAHLSKLETQIGFGSTEFHVIRASEVIDPAFIYYITASSYFRNIGEAFMSGSGGQKRVPTSFVENYPIAFPPLPEQRAIAAYLYRKTAQLDTLLDHKRALLDLLQRKQQALINEAVTQGLDPLAPRKPSGVDWLGEVPTHWVVKRLKTVSQFITSGSRGWAEHYSEEGPIFLRIGNLSISSIELKLHNLQRVTPPAGAEGERTKVQPNDMLISITALLGAVGIVPQEVQEAYVNQHIALVRLNQELIHPKWAAYFFSSPVGKHQFRTLTNGGTKEGLTLGDIATLILPYPSYVEQGAIVAQIEAKTSKITNATTAIQTQIDTLKAYRQALISEVVTGKVDVRVAAEDAPSVTPPATQQLGLFE
jgi:type I restriction enzyme S subunit